MIKIINERKSNVNHILYFRVGIGKLLTYCRRPVRSIYVNSYGVSDLYGVTCPKCISEYNAWQDTAFRSFRSYSQTQRPGKLAYRLGAIDRYDLDGEYWYKLFKMKGSLNRLSKYHDAIKTKVHKSKKVSANKKRR